MAGVFHLWVFPRITSVSCERNFKPRVGVCPYRYLRKLKYFIKNVPRYRLFVDSPEHFILEHGSKYTERKVRKIPTVRGADIMRDPKVTKVCVKFVVSRALDPNGIWVSGEKTPHTHRKMSSVCYFVYWSPNIGLSFGHRRIKSTKAITI